MKLLLLLLIVNSASLKAEIVKIFSTKEQIFINDHQMFSQLIPASYIVLGEFHNDQEIQNAQAEIITQVSKIRNSHFNVMWEFLDFTNNVETTLEFDKFRSNQITATDFLTNTKNDQNLSYLPIIEAIKKNKGNIIGINLPRHLKQRVVKEGIQSIDPGLVPSSHYVGGDDYLERFTETMIDHIPANKIPHYFLAQCLTDSVMAFQASQFQSEYSFVIAGSFHTDFDDATVERLKRLTNQKVATLKLINEKLTTPTESIEYLQGHSKFGQYADYIVFVSAKEE